MTENLKKFLEYASKNEDTMKKIKALSEETDRDTLIHEAVEIAKDANLPLSAEDFEEKTGGELSDDELASVAGGKTCVCVIGGGGESSYDGYGSTNNETCICVSVGGGSATPPGWKYWNDPAHEQSETRCVCIVGGYGEDLDL